MLSGDAQAKKRDGMGISCSLSGFYRITPAANFLDDYTGRTSMILILRGSTITISSL